MYNSFLKKNKKHKTHHYKQKNLLKKIEREREDLLATSVVGSASKLPVSGWNLEQ